MKSPSQLIIVLCCAVVVAGCATKRYGRLQGLTDAEKSVYECKDINLELAKIAEFRRSMAEEAKTDARSVGAFLMDFGIGNKLEKDDAERSVNAREADVLSLKASKNCS